MKLLDVLAYLGDVPRCSSCFGHSLTIFSSLLRMLGPARLRTVLEISGTPNGNPAVDKIWDDA